MTQLNDWLSIDKTSGTGNAQITLSASSYEELVERSATIKVQGINTNAILTVKQEALVPYLTLSNNIIHFNPVGSITITVSSNMEWEALTNDDWYTLSQTSGTKGETNVTITALSIAKQRLGEIIFKSGSITATLTINQAFESNMFITNGGNSYIDLEYVPNNNTTEIEMELIVEHTLNMYNGSRYLLGGDGDGSTIFDVSVGVNGWGNGYLYNVKFQGYGGMFLSDFGPIIDENNGNNFAIKLRKDGIYTAGTEIPLTTIGTTTNFTNSLKLFYNYDYDGAWVGRVNIYEGDTIVHSFVPFSDGQNVGLLDLINAKQHFFKSKASSQTIKTISDRVYVNPNNDGVILAPSKRYVNHIVVCGDDIPTIKSNKGWLTYEVVSHKNGFAYVNVYAIGEEGESGILTVNGKDITVKMLKGNKLYYTNKNNKLSYLDYRDTSNITFAFRKDYSKKEIYDLGIWDAEGYTFIEKMDAVETHIMENYYDGNCDGFGGYIAFDEEDCFRLDGSLSDRYEGITSIKLPDVYTLGDWQFAFCDDLERVYLPKSLKYADGIEAFLNTPTLKEMYIYADTAPKIMRKDNPNACFDGMAENGVLYYPKDSDYSGWLTEQQGVINPYRYGWTGSPTL